MKSLNILLVVLLSITGVTIKAQKSSPKSTKDDYIVGTIPSDFGVSPSGAAIYKIPIDIPNGVAGLKPDINLIYNSKVSGNILGKGWTLEGFSVITRTRPTYYYNGFVDNIDFDNDDLMLDGKHLIKISENSKVTEYRIENDFSTKIERKTDKKGEPYFIVFTKNGRIIEYGHTVDSKLMYSGNTFNNEPLAWYVNNVKDRKKNEIVYEYDPIIVNGEIHPKSIKYTERADNKTAGGKITFTYNTQSEEFPMELHKAAYFEKGGLSFLNKNTWILEKIQITNFDGTKKYKDYEISYYKKHTNVCEEFFVKDINLTAYKDNVSIKVKPTHFDWGFYQPEYNHEYNSSQTEYIKSNSKLNTLALDVTGDGKDEVATYKLKLNDPEDWLNFTPVISVYLNELTHVIDIPVTNTLFENQIHAIDWDMDGDQELLFVDGDGLKIYDYDATTEAMIQVYLYPNVDKAFPGDFNGDGINDILVVSETLCKVLEGQYDEANNSFTYIVNDNSYTLENNGEIEKIVTVSDFNGDGKQEILSKILPNYEYNTISFTSENGFEKINHLYVAPFQENNRQATYFDDFNGDGKTDICYIQETSPGTIEKEIYFSYGDKYLQAQEVKTNKSFPTFIEDFNNDGRADFVNVTTSNNDFVFTFHFTQPDGITTKVETARAAILHNFDDVELCIGDVDGNGIKDIIITLRKRYIINNKDTRIPSYEEVTIQPYLGTGNTSDKVKSIVNGLGLMTKINYSPINPYTNLNYNFPISKSLIKGDVVNETYSVGKDNVNINRKVYTFNNPLVHLQGKGFLGFSQTIVNNYQSNVQTKTDLAIYTQDHKYYFPYPHISKKYPIDENGQVLTNLLSKSTNTIDTKVKGTNNYIYYPFTRVSHTKIWDTDGTYVKTVKKVTNKEDIDQYGNVKKSMFLVDPEDLPVDIPDEEYDYKTTTEVSFEEYYDEENWLISRPAWSITTKGGQLFNANEEASVKKEYTYYLHGQDNWPLLESVKTTPNLTFPHENNKSNNYITQTDYVYDEFGNVILKTTTAPESNPPLPPIVTSYSYSSNGRFLLRKTQDPNGLNYTTDYTYNSLTGNLITNTFNKDGNPILSQYYYDNLGRLIKTINADGTSLNTEYNWANEGDGLLYAPEDAVYYIFNYTLTNEQRNKTEKSFTYFDKYHQKIRTVSFDIENNAVIQNVTYNDKGQPFKIYQPQFFEGQQQPEYFTEFEYDNYGRLLTKTTPTNSFAYSYSGRTLRIDNNGTSNYKTKTVNAIGQVSTIKDPAGSVAYNYLSSGLPAGITAIGAATSFKYDAAGNRKEVTESNTGNTSTIYNAYGQVVTNSDNKGNTYEMKYDVLGRIIEKKCLGTTEDITYTYINNPNKNGFGNIEKQEGSNNIIYTYIYDKLGRIVKKTENIESHIFEIEFAYDPYNGKLARYTYPTGYYLEYDYANNGALYRVLSGQTKDILWQAVHTNVLGQLTDFTLGNGLSTHKGFDDFGFPTEIVTGNVQNLKYNFDAVTGNLNWRKDLSGNLSLVENFEYDNLLHNRLTHWQVTGQNRYSVSFKYNGNISQKTDVTASLSRDGRVGFYLYGNNAGNNAVTTIDNPTHDYFTAAEPTQEINYTAFNKISDITQVGSVHHDETDFTYGPDLQRKKTIFYHDRPEGKVKYYVGGNFEVEIDNQTNNKRYLHYLSAGNGLFAIFVQNSNNSKADTMYYVQKDYLGSYYCITDKTGNIVENKQGEKQIFSFDPWGRRRNPRDWTYNNIPTSYIFDRGYTGHQQMDVYGLINMNGRLYDPRLGRMLNPDPFVQNTENSQNFNRYSYALNNPLKYTDPSGFTYKPSYWDDGNGGATDVNAAAWASLTNNQGYNGPGSGNHWSDAYRGEYGNYMLMNSSTFNNVYGEGAYETANQIMSNPFLSQAWISGQLNLSQVDFTESPEDVNVIETKWANYVGTTDNPHKKFLGYNYTYSFDGVNDDQADGGEGIISDWWNNHWTAKFIPDVIYLNVGTAITTSIGWGYSTGYALQIRGKEGFGIRTYETVAGKYGVHGAIGLNVGYSSYSGDSRNFSFYDSFYGEGTTGYEIDYIFGIGASQSPLDKYGGVLRSYDFGMGPGYGASYNFFTGTSPY